MQSRVSKRFLRFTKIQAIILYSAESGGVCTFCGAKIALSSQESSEVRPPFAERSVAPDSQGQPGSSTPANAAADEKVAEAVAFKNRLVRVFITKADYYSGCRSALLRVRWKEYLKQGISAVLGGPEQCKLVPKD